MYTHTGGYPFNCDQCGSGFATEYKYKRHMMTHTGDYPWKCEHCGQGFRDEHKLREEHIKKIHPIQYEMFKSNKMRQTIPNLASAAPVDLQSTQPTTAPDTMPSTSHQSSLPKFPGPVTSKREFLEPLRKQQETDLSIDQMSFEQATRHLNQQALQNASTFLPSSMNGNGYMN